MKGEKTPLVNQMSSPENFIEEWPFSRGCRDTASLWETGGGQAPEHSLGLQDPGLPLLSGRWDMACDERLLFSAQHAFYSKRGRLKESSVLKDLWGIKLPSLWGSNKEDYLYSTELFKILPPRNFIFHFLSAFHWHLNVFRDSSLYYKINIFKC